MKNALEILFFVSMTCSCATQYRISGVTSIPMFEGRMVYLKSNTNAHQTKMDSCKVANGKFDFSGTSDSTLLAELYVGGSDRVVPLVMENGNIKVSIGLVGETVSGGALNGKLADYMARSASYEDLLRRNVLMQVQLRMRGELTSETFLHLQKTRREILTEKERLNVTFIRDNHGSPLGSEVFFLLYGRQSYPYLSRQVKDIVMGVPKDFLTHPDVNGYILCVSSSNEE